jgi:hypothetical protein
LAKEQKARGRAFSGVRQFHFPPEMDEVPTTFG